MEIVGTLTLEASFVHVVRFEQQPVDLYYYSVFYYYYNCVADSNIVCYQYLKRHSVNS